MPAESTWGIPKAVRSILAARNNELRVGLQEDARRHLAALGIAAEASGPSPGGRTPSADEEGRRDVVLVLDAYVDEVAFTLLDWLEATSNA